MIEFTNLSSELPFKLFKEKYDEAAHQNQKNIEAICISSYSSSLQEVNARYVNLKQVKEKEFIFFTNYDSPKSKEFEEHNQITCLIFWNSINTQIRIKANIKSTSKKLNNDYFSQRSQSKNALAISSKQSKPIESYNKVISNYEKIFETANLYKCPDYWGGFSFTPYYFEFWQGHESRINKREVFDKIDGSWKHLFIQP